MNFVVMNAKDDTKNFSSMRHAQSTHSSTSCNKVYYK